MSAVGVRLLDALEAAHTGNAVRSRTVRHHHLSRAPLVVCAYHLANEPGAVIGLLVGSTRSKPAVFAMGNPLNRDLRFAVLAQLADLVNGYLDGHAAVHRNTRTPQRGPNAGKERTEALAVDTPQLLVPNSATAEWLGTVLGRTLRYLKPAEQGVDPSLPVLGAHLTFLHQQAISPTSTMLLPATTLLAEHWTTGQLGSETENLPALLAWIRPQGFPDGRTAAAEAEKHSPAGPAPVAEFDDALYAAWDRWGERTDAGADPVSASAQMRAEVKAALLPGYQATFDALALARKLPAAGHDADRHTADRRAWARHYARVTSGEARFRAQLDALSAARVLGRSEDDSAEFARQQVLDDPRVAADLLVSGEALSGTVALVDPDHRVGKRSYRPRVVVAPNPGYPRAAGARLYWWDQPATAGVVVQTDPFTGRVTLELSGGMGRGRPQLNRLPAPGDVVLFTPYGAKEWFPDTLPDELPWTHEIPDPAAGDTSTDSGTDTSSGAGAAPKRRTTNRPGTRKASAKSGTRSGQSGRSAAAPARRAPR